jgi:SAM-dependent methyltransferase
LRKRENKVDLRPIVRAYDSYLARRAEDARRVGWRDSESQSRKFAEICELFAADDTSFSVYDLGCGLANMYEFLKDRHPQARYTGCDIHEGMITNARSRNPSIELECRDIRRSPPKKRYDYVTASGTFNLRLKNDRGQWSAYTASMLRIMYRIARRGIAVGFLSSFASQKERREYHADPSVVLSYAQRHLSPLAEIRHSQSPGHFALFVYRKAPGLQS